MYHSITFGDKNTWDDWHLIPEKRPLFNPPPVKTSIIEIPGSDGLLDLTTALSGRPLYGNRTGSWDFVVEPGFKDWTLLYSEIMSHLHGQKMTAVLEDDPSYYYEGRFSVNKWDSDRDWSRITIDYSVGPFKNYAIGSDRWEWDTFNFETGIIRNYKNLVVAGNLSVTIVGEFIDTIPAITCSAAGMKVTYLGNTYNLNRGVNVLRDIVFNSGENILQFTGNGKVTIQAIGGRL